MRLNERVGQPTISRNVRQAASRIRALLAQYQFALRSCPPASGPQRERCRPLNSRQQPLWSKSVRELACRDRLGGLPIHRHQRFVASGLHCSGQPQGAQNSRLQRPKLEKRRRSVFEPIAKFGGVRLRLCRHYHHRRANLPQIAVSHAPVQRGAVFGPTGPAQLEKRSFFHRSKAEAATDVAQLSDGAGQ